MKRIVLMFVAVFAALALVACATTTTEAPILARADKDYYATGNFAGWGGAVGSEDYKMEAIRVTDARVASIVSQLTGATALYIKEVVLPSGAAGWDVSYTIGGVVTVFDGNLTVKVVRTLAGDADSIDFWAQNPESGAITNLTPATLYMPTFQAENTDGTGDHNSNPVAKAAGTYYLVYAEFGTTSKAMALIVKP